MHYVMPLSFLEKAIRRNGSVLSILISDQTLRWTVWKENFADNVFHSSDRSVVTTFCCGMWKEKKRFEGRKKTFALTEIVFVQIEELNLFTENKNCQFYFLSDIQPLSDYCVNNLSSSLIKLNSFYRKNYSLRTCELNKSITFTCQSSIGPDIFKQHRYIEKHDSAVFFRSSLLFQLNEMNVFIGNKRNF